MSRMASGSNPPAWALVELRDDSRGTPGQLTPTTTPTPTLNGSTTPETPSKPPSMMSSRDFEFLKELGSGSWSTVMEASHVGTGKRFAVKILSKAQLIKQKKVKYASVEKDALAKLAGTHPGIVRMHAAFQDETSLYFVLDLAPNGDLADLVRKYGSLNLPCARWYTAQIVDAVLWMHSKGIVHRDMKPENVLLDAEMRVKLTDFGSAYIAQNLDLSPRSSTFVGSAAYVSPELLNRASKTTSSSSDLWAIGCTLYFLIAGTPAFAAINDYQSFRKIEALDYQFPDGFFESAKDLVEHLVVLDPSERLGAEPESSPDALRAHRFFSVDESAQEDGSGDAIHWEALWTNPSVQPETGIVPPTFRDTQEDDADDPWDNVIHAFSLANITSSSNSPFPPPPPIDVPPDVVPTEVTETILNGVDHESKSADAADPALSTKDWVGVLAPSESVRRTVSTRASFRWGLLKQTRPCMLVLTSQPRIICVVPDEKRSVHTSANVKKSFTFTGHSNNSIKGDKYLIVSCRSDESQKKLVLQTAEKEYAYEFPDLESLQVWRREVAGLIDPS